MVGIARMRAQRADEDLCLRALRFVDEHEAPSRRRGRLRELVLDVGPLGQRAHEERAERLCLFLGDGAGEADDDVRLNEPPRVGRDHVVALERLDALRAPRGAARIRVPGEQRTTEREARQRAIVVPCLEQLGHRLALQACELLGVEGGGAEHLHDQLDERQQVSPDDLRMAADGRRADIEAELAAEPIGGALDLRRGHPLAAATHHASGEPREPVLPLGVGEGAAA